MTFPRFRKFLHCAAPLASLTIAILLIALAVASIFGCVDMTDGTPQQNWSFAACHGRLRFAHAAMPFTTPPIPWTGSATPWREGAHLDFTPDEPTTDNQFATLWWNSPIQSPTGDEHITTHSIPLVARLHTGTVFDYLEGGNPHAKLHVAAPVWCLEFHAAWPIALSLLLPALFLRSWRRHRHASRQGLCPTCHYDLRAHHPGDKCPECGTPIPRLCQGPEISHVGTSD
jgi:hypothetical protein